MRAILPHPARISEALDSVRWEMAPQSERQALPPGSFGFLSRRRQFTTNISGEPERYAALTLSTIPPALPETFAPTFAERASRRSRRRPTHRGHVLRPTQAPGRSQVQNRSRAQSKISGPHSKRIARPNKLPAKILFLGYQKRIRDALEPPRRDRLLDCLNFVGPARPAMLGDPGFHPALGLGGAAHCFRNRCEFGSGGIEREVL